MGKRKGSWRKFFCCAGPPETQSSTCVNINESHHVKHPLESELEQEDEDLYIEAEVQTSNVEIPEGNRWRWSRLHNEVEVQTSLVSLPVEEAESASEMDAQMQTSFLSLPREVEAQAQTSFLSLWSPAPFEAEAQVQTSFTERLRESCTEAQVQTSLLSLPREREAQVQTSLLALPREREIQVQMSLLSLPGEREAQVQTSLLSLPGEREAQVQTSQLSLPGEREAQVQTSQLSLPGEREVQVQTSFLPFPERQSVISIQVQPSYIEVLEKISSLPVLVEAQVQTSNLEMPPSETDTQIQTSFSDYMSDKGETASIETEQQSNRSPSQLSEVDFSTLYPLYINAEAQTLPVEIPPGNDWRSARLKAAAQVQTSNISLEKPVPLPQVVMQVQPSKLKSGKSEMLVEELEAPLAIKEKFLPSKPIEIGIQAHGPEIQEEDKWSLSQRSNAQVQPSTIELLKKLSLLSQIETMESTSHTELLKKVSSLSVTEPHMQTSSYELQRKPSSLSDSATQGQVLNVELLKKRLSTAQVIPLSDDEPAGKLCLPSPAKEVQIQTSDVELMKNLSSSSHMESQGRTSDADLQKYSSLSLIEAMDGNQEEITEGREYLITPQLIEAQIRKWYHEFPEVQTASQAPVQSEPLLPLTVDREVQTSSHEIPQGNRWRASRLQANAEVQTLGLESAVEEVKSCHQSWNETQTQTSLLEIWQSRGLADAQIQTSDLGLATTNVKPPPPLVIDSQVQASLLDIWKANSKADGQTQTLVTELPKQALDSSSTQKVDRPAQTSFLEICKAKEPCHVQQKATEFLEPKEGDSLLQTDLEVQTSLPDMQRRKEKTDVRVQTSLLEIPDAQEELPLSLQTSAEVQTSDVEIPMGSRWRASRLHADVQLQTSVLDMKEAELESPPPSQMDTQVQTSLLDIWKTKDLRDARAQTSRMDMSKSLEEPPLSSQPENVVQPPTPGTTESSPPSQVDTEVQTSFLDIWKTKEVSSSLAQTSQMDMSKSLEEPLLPPQSENVVQPPTSETAESSPPSQVDTEAQTSFLDMWKAKDLRDARAQTSRMDMSKSLVEPLLPPQLEDVVPSPTLETTKSALPSQADTEAQTSFFDIWKAKEISSSLAQTSQMDISQSLEEPLLPPQPENVVQPPTSEAAESSPPSQVDTEAQTSFLDIWKAKDLRDARAQTSRMDMSKSLEEPLLPPQPENVVQPPTSEAAESSPPFQIDTEAQTSFLDIWKAKDLRDARAQTSGMDMSKSLVEPLLPPQPEDVVPLPTLETTKSALPSQADTEAQTSFFDIWKAKDLRDGQMQTSWLDLPKSMEEPLLQSQSESLMQIATPPDQFKPEKQTSLLEIWKAREPMASSEMPRSSPSPADAKVQTSQLDMDTLADLPSPQVLSSKSDLASATLKMTVPSRTVSPVHLPMPANVEEALLAQTDSQLPTSLLEVWTTRQEAEVQMQTANLGLSFDKNSPLFPIVLESQEEKRLEQICKVEGKSKPPIFTEAQVQTSFVEIPRGKKWRSSRICTEAQVQTSFPDLRLKDRMPALQKMVGDHMSAKRAPKGPKRATPVSVHLHVKMSPKRRTSNEKK